MQNVFPIIAFISISVLFLTAGMTRLGFGVSKLKHFAWFAAIINLMGAIGAGVVLAVQGPVETGFLGIAGLGISLRLDSVSAIMYAMISLLSMVILKFSFNYLDGDKRQGVFLGRLAAALASVELLVLSGNLGVLFFSWVLTSISLHRLLIFYRERPGAIVAARKKFVIARCSDLFLLFGITFLYKHFETGNLQYIFTEISRMSIDNIPAAVEWSCVLLALAAIFKSAQFPTHGWLMEVMETPTPVSALLHAGLINAGPFLIIRMAYLFNSTVYASNLLLIVGAITALFGSIVYVTQTSVKTTLAYSSIAHMGFSLLMCGLGAYPAAMLHLVAHSFYKAHSFLSSGSVIETLRASGKPEISRVGNPLKIGLGLSLALAFFVGIIKLGGIDPLLDFQLLFISLVIMLGLVQLFISTLDSNSAGKLLIKVFSMGLYLIGSFLLLEKGFSYLMTNSAPVLVELSNMTLLISAAILLLFSIVVLVQVSAPLMGMKHKYVALAIHVKNGFYINTLFDRMVGALQVSIPVVDLSQAERAAQPKLSGDLVPVYNKQ